MTRLYLDSAPIIYLIENVTPFAEPLAARLAFESTLQICSDLSRLECRVKPIREKNKVLLAAYDSYFNDIAAEILPLSRAVTDQAADLRARYNFRTPDALHLACAIYYRCDMFLTNDRQLSLCQEIPVVLIE
ncbi:MAG: PIN domain-containing protein [Chloroflexi bacterium]|nr:PIN domain-containing protein [Chloroflexota bacterium]